MKTSSLEPIRYLSRDEMDAIHKSALRILERTGMWVDHAKALEYLRDAGCRVDMDRRSRKVPGRCDGRRRGPNAPQLCRPQPLAQAYVGSVFAGAI